MEIIDPCHISLGPAYFLIETVGAGARSQTLLARTLVENLPFKDTSIVCIYILISLLEQGNQS
tara:strand:+ start:431 stop:619 length:189 start_codon:yes stop_codon:yes gene_type:complete